MRLLACLCLAAAASFPAAAGAGPGDPPAGERCAFDTVGAPVSEDTYSGVIYGGPLAAPGSTVTITCSVKVDAGLHSDPALVTETSAPGAGVAVLEPRQLTYAAEDWQTTYFCTAATVDGTAWYWDGATDTWSADPGVRCERPTVTRIPPDTHTCLDCVVELLDETACLALAALPPVSGPVGIEPEGDVHVAGEPFWDCPPYDEWDGPSAAPGPGPPVGAPCGFATVQGNQPVSPSEYHGVIHGGPLAAPGAELSITCSIVLNDDSPTAPAVVSESAGPSANTVTLPPTPMVYVAEDSDVPYLCTTATVDGAAWYWDEDAAAWSPDPAGTCDAAESVHPGDPGPCGDMSACLVTVLDALVCPVLATLPSVPGVVDVEHDGDVHVAGEPFWDCPPYEEW